MGIEKLKEGLAVITAGQAYIKLKENGEIDYIRIDNRKFTNIEKMGDQIISYSQNMQKAIKIMRQYHYLKDLPESIPDFVIKYHPAWINFRQTAGYLNDFTSDGEIACTVQNEVKTYNEWMSDSFLAIGEKEYYPPKLNPDALITKSVFEDLIRPEIDTTNDKSEVELASCFHRDTQALILTTRWKNIIDSGRSDGINMRNVHYKLDPTSNFPVIVTGTNNNKKVYDFRKSRAVLGFTKYLSKRNPHNTKLKSEVKKLEKVFRGY